MITYELLIRLWHPSLESRFTQWQTNIAKAQGIIYDDGLREKNWIAGTSLSNRLNIETLTGFRSCSFGGFSLFEAFRIMNELEIRPDTILVEINVIDRSESRQFQDAILHPVLFETRKYLYSMRQAAQPIGLTVRYSRLLTTGFFRTNKVTTLKNRHQNNPNSENRAPLKNHFDNDDRLTASIASIKSEYSKGVDNSHLSKQLQILKSKISPFEAAGTKIIFFEIPVHHSLINLKKPEQIRNAFRSVFPESEYTYLPNDSRPYQTTDGVHLNGVEGKQYAEFIRSNLKKND